MDYIELLEKYMQGLTTPEEEKALLDWIQHDGDARSTISAFYEKRWKETPDTGVSAELQYKMLMNIKQNICQHETENQSAAGRKIVWMNVMKYAAAILVTMVVSVFSAYYFYSSESDVKNFVVYADKGQRSNLVLPDKIRLTGEAYFEVAKDKEHRFLVSTGLMDVEALGTAFNVQSYPNEDEITTTLLEGKVKISTPEQEAILLPNQQACFGKSSNGLSVIEVENAKYSNSWTKGEFAFNGATLEEIAKELSRMYNMEIKFDSDETIIR